MLKNTSQMQIFNRIRQLFQARTISDELLGTLSFHETNHVWFGKVVFEPQNKEIDISLRGNETGFESGQKSIYKEIKDRWTSLKETVEPKMQATLVSWFDMDEKGQPSQSDIWNKVNLIALFIESVDRSNDNWQDFELVFDVKNEREHSLVVHIKDWHPISCHFE